MKSVLLLILISFIFADQTYTVQSGYTLGGIASRFGVTVSDLVSWNNIANPDLIYPGQNLVIKKGSSSSSDTKPTPSSGGNGKVYKITDAQMQKMGWKNYNLADLNNCLKRFESYSFLSCVANHVIQCSVMYFLVYFTYSRTSSSLVLK